MTSITRWVLAHKRLVAAFWLVMTLVGMVFAGSASKALKQSFSVPGREGWKANVAIARLYCGGGDHAPLVPVVTLPAGRTVDSAGVRAAPGAVERRLAHALPGSRTASYASTGSRALVSRDGRTAFVLAYPPPGQGAFGDNPQAQLAARRALAGATVAGAPVHLTGFDALQASTGGGQGPGVLVEALLGGVGALVVLAFVFASALALVPLLIALVSIMTSFLAVWALTTVTDVSPIVQFLIALIGLGVAIDYSLLVVVRWREERAHGREGDAAVLRAMETAGRSVVFSGTTVGIGLLALVALPLPFLRSVGYGGMLIPVISVLVSITLLPVILSRFGQRLDWPHLRTDDRASRAWTAWANLVVRRRWVAATTALVVLAALVVSATSLQPGTPNADTLAKQGDGRQGLAALERSGIGAGALQPLEAVARGGSPERVAGALGKVDGIHGAVAPPGGAWRRVGTALIDAVPTADGSTSAGRATVRRVRAVAHAAGDVAVGGQGAQNADFISAVYGNFPLMIALIAVVTFVLLARAFRSLLLPLKAVVLNVISVGAAWGVIALVWQHGHGSNAIWGIAATHSVTAWIPLMVFAFLFGLSMDYEVFILARMREEYDATGSTDTAVIRGIGRTGRLVTSAAIILFLAFTSMASAPSTDVKILATGLAAGILLDATVIRALLVPAVVSLFGRWNWWLPQRPARLLRVEPSLPPRSAAKGAR